MRTCDVGIGVGIQKVIIHSLTHQTRVCINLHVNFTDVMFSQSIKFETIVLLVPYSLLTHPDEHEPNQVNLAKFHCHGVYFNKKKTRDKLTHTHLYTFQLYLPILYGNSATKIPWRTVLWFNAFISNFLFFVFFFFWVKYAIALPNDLSSCSIVSVFHVHMFPQ